MAKVKVNADGKAPKGLSVGDSVVTGGGTYKITGVNSDGSYKSEKVSNETTSTYKGSYDSPGGGNGSMVNKSSRRYASGGGGSSRNASPTIANAANALSAAANGSGNWNGNTYKVGSDGKAPKGLSVGTDVVTGGGTYRIMGINADGTYQSQKINNVTTGTYSGVYANAPYGGAQGLDLWTPGGINGSDGKGGFAAYGNGDFQDAEGNQYSHLFWDLLTDGTIRNKKTGEIKTYNPGDDRTGKKSVFSDVIKAYGENGDLVRFSKPEEIEFFNNAPAGAKMVLNGATYQKNTDGGVTITTNGERRVYKTPLDDGTWSQTYQVSKNRSGGGGGGGGSGTGTVQTYYPAQPTQTGIPQTTQSQAGMTMPHGWTEYAYDANGKPFTMSTQAAYDFLYNSTEKTMTGANGIVFTRNDDGSVTITEKGGRTSVWRPQGAGGAATGSGKEGNTGTSGQSVNGFRAVSLDGDTYDIGSEKGMDFVKNAKPGESIIGGDNSVWNKNADGSVTITKNGKTYVIEGGVTGVYPGEFSFDSFADTDAGKQAKADLDALSQKLQEYSRQMEAVKMGEYDTTPYDQTPEGQKAREEIQALYEKVQAAAGEIGSYQPDQFNYTSFAQTDAGRRTAADEAAALDQMAQAGDALRNYRQGNFDYTAYGDSAQGQANAQRLQDLYNLVMGTGSDLSAYKPDQFDYTAYGDSAQGQANAQRLQDLYQKAAAAADAANNYNPDAFDYTSFDETERGKALAAQQQAAGDRLNNYAPFSYDPNQDPLYQQYAESYTRNGQRAMQDTLGQMSARTGGLASSYAGTAAQQTYDQYMSALADKIPELRNIAYAMYTDDYNRAQGDYNRAYQQYADAASRYSQDESMRYGIYQDAVNRGERQAEGAYNRALNAYNMGYQQDADAAARYNQDVAMRYGMYQDQTEAERQRLQNAYNQSLNAYNMGYQQDADAAARYNQDVAMRYGMYQDQTEAERQLLQTAYDMAADTYNASRQRGLDAYNQYSADQAFRYGLHQDQTAAERDRLANAYNMSIDAYNMGVKQDAEAYDRYRTGQQDQYQQAADAYNRNYQAASDAYGRAADAYNIGRKEYEDAYNQYVDNRNLAYDMRQDQITNDWRNLQSAQDAQNARLDEYYKQESIKADQASQKQREKEFAYQKEQDQAQFANQKEQDERNYQLTERQYKDSLKAELRDRVDRYGYVPTQQDADAYGLTPGELASLQEQARHVRAADASKYYSGW